MKKQLKSSSYSEKQRPQSSKPYFNKKGKAKSARKAEKNNYQDEAMDREYEKGVRAGKLTSKLRANRGMNDISWYARHPQLLSDTCSFPFGFPAGLRFPMDKVVTRQDFPTPYKDHKASYLNISFGVSGIMTIGIAPTVGVSIDNNSPINVASLNNYDTVRKANSGAKNYDNPDLTLYYIAMDSIYMYWNWLQRLYGLIWYVDPENRYTPRAMVECQGVDFDDLTANIANFRAYINKRAIDMQAFCVPAEFSYFLRHSWLMTNVYTDANNKKAQMYMFVPSWVYKYSEMTSSKGGELIPIKILQGITYDKVSALPNKRLKVLDLMNILDELITAALKSQDIGIISGDVLKAYGQALFTLAPMSEDYVVTPAYNQEVLMQIENATVIPVDDEFTAENYKITQDPNTNQINWNPVIEDSQAFGLSSVFINMHAESPTPQDVMIATRLVSTLYRDSENKFRFSAVGSEFVTGVYFHINGPQAQSAAADIPWIANGFGEDMDLVATNNLKLRTVYLDTFKATIIHTKVIDGPGARAVEISTLEKICTDIVLSHFDWHPLIYNVAVSEHSDRYKYYTILPLTVDIEKYAIVSSFNLNAIHLVALMSLLGV